MKRLLSLGLASLVLLPLLGPTASFAAVTPPAVSGVSVRGGHEHSEVAIHWQPPKNVPYAGARVVVVPGVVATANPADAAAVFTADVAGAAYTGATWRGGAAGQRYSVSVFAYAEPGGSYAAAATAKVAIPGPVRHLVITRYERTVVAHYALPAYADGAVLCYRSHRAPMFIADARGCEKGRDASGLNVPYGDWFFSVFALDSATGIYGPPVSSGDGVLPVETRNQPGDMAIDATRLTFMWKHDSLGGLKPGFADDRRWEVRWAAGTVSPVQNPAARSAVVSTSGDVTHEPGFVYERLQVSGLKPGVPYTFAVRTINSVDEASSWELHTASTRLPGAYVVDNASAPGRWSTSKVPTGTNDDDTVFAVEPDGSVNTGSYDFVGTRGSALAHSRRPGGSWSRAKLPADVLPGLRMVASATSPGLLAMTDSWCVRVRSKGAWRKVGCMHPPPDADYPDPSDAFEVDLFQNGSSGVFGLELDKRGAVHVLYRGDGPNTGDDRYLMYASDASGSWVTRRVSALGDNGTASLTYDVGTDRLVLVTGDSYAKDTRYQLRISSKTPQAVNFAAFAIRHDAPVARAVVPVGIASAGGRITVAARRSAPWSSFAWGSPVLLTGTSPNSVGAMAAIPGAQDAEDVRVFAQSSTRVFVGWARRGFGKQQGVWSSWRTYGPGGAGAMSAPVRHTATAYDTLTGLAVDVRGRSYVLLQRR